jgi:hypothetical protein
VTAQAGPPILNVSLVGAQTVAGTHHCNVVWRLENQGAQPVELAESWLPHGQFRAPREAFVPLLILPSRDSVLHSRQVEVVVAPGGLVQNAFLIFRVFYRGDPWRIFARMNVESTLDGSVQPIMEAVTASPISAEA